jgi:hypothetical protein
MKGKELMDTIRLLARISGTLLVFICVSLCLMVLIDGLNNPKPGPGLEAFNIVLFSVLGIGLVALILAWWFEGLGGFVSLISFVIFNILAACNPIPGSIYIFLLLIFLVPSLLYLYYWWLKRKALHTISTK